MEPDPGGLKIHILDSCSFFGVSHLINLTREDMDALEADSGVTGYYSELIITPGNRPEKDQGAETVDLTREGGYKMTASAPGYGSSTGATLEWRAFNAAMSYLISNGVVNHERIENADGEYLGDKYDLDRDGVFDVVSSVSMNMAVVHTFTAAPDTNLNGLYKLTLDEAAITELNRSDSVQAFFSVVEFRFGTDLGPYTADLTAGGFFLDANSAEFAAIRNALDAMCQAGQINSSNPSETLTAYDLDKDGVTDLRIDDIGAKKRLSADANTKIKGDFNLKPNAGAAAALAAGTDVYYSGLTFKFPGKLVNPFVDVKEGKYYYNPVLWAYYHEPYQITKGTDDTHFSPNQTCTRAQVVTFLYNLLAKSNG